MSIDNAAQRAYETYCKSIGMADDLAPWSEQSEQVKAGWVKAVRAGVDTFLDDAVNHLALAMCKGGEC